MSLRFQDAVVRSHAIDDDKDDAERVSTVTSVKHGRASLDVNRALFHLACQARRNSRGESVPVYHTGPAAETHSWPSSSGDGVCVFALQRSPPTLCRRW